MILYIKLDEDGGCVNHPHLAENLYALYPDHDFDSGPPTGWALFTRVSPPEIGPYELFEDCGCENCDGFTHNGLTYELQDDGTFSDVWHVRQMTAEEKTSKQDAVKADWSENGFASWVFNEDTCSFDAPVAYPDDGNEYTWNEETTSWEEVE